MKYKSTARLLRTKAKTTLFTGLLMFLFSSASLAQLGVYTFTGHGNCPNQDPAVSAQPANAVFSDFTNVNADCSGQDDVFEYKQWNQGNSIDLTQYHQFTVTANPGYTLTLNSLSFTQFTNDNPSSGTTRWILRSSIDNYTTDIATGAANTTTQVPVVTLPSPGFTNINSVTFRFYILNINGNGTRWTIDNVTLNGSVIGATVIVLPGIPANPTSNSPQCMSTGVTMNFNGASPVGETWYWQTSPTDTSTLNSPSSYTVNTPGTYTYYVRSQDNATLAWSAGAGIVNITVLPGISTPVFAAGAIATRCQGAGTVNYTATALNSTGITYSLDAASVSGGNTIDPLTGDVTYAAGWSGTTTITATVASCSSMILPSCSCRTTRSKIVSAVIPFSQSFGSIDSPTVR